jgi:heme exporter protein D
MRYVVAGYVIVLSLLFLYGVQLVWRRRKLTRTVARIAAAEAARVTAAPDDSRSGGS